MAAVPGMVLHRTVLRHCWFNEWIRYTKSLVGYSEVRKSNLSPQHSETWNWHQVAQKPLNYILILNSLMPTITDNSKREQEFWGMWRKDERFKPNSGSNLKKWKFRVQFFRNMTFKFFWLGTHPWNTRGMYSNIHVFTYLFIKYTPLSGKI